MRDQFTLFFIILASALICCLTIACSSIPQNEEPDTDGIRGLPETAEILFSSNRDTGTTRQDIYSMDTRGGSVTRIAFTEENQFVVDIDDSKLYLAATRGTENKKRLWLLDLQTGEDTPLTDAANHTEGHNLSPDGKWIAFWMIVSGEAQTDIYKIKRDGSELTYVADSAATDIDPAFSGYGNRILFISNTGHHRSWRLDGNAILFEQPIAFAGEGENGTA